MRDPGFGRSWEHSEISETDEVSGGGTSSWKCCSEATNSKEERRKKQKEKKGEKSFSLESNPRPISGRPLHIFTLRLCLCYFSRAVLYLLLGCPTRLGLVPEPPLAYVDQKHGREEGHGHGRVGISLEIAVSLFSIFGLLGGLKGHTEVQDD